MVETTRHDPFVQVLTLSLFDEYRFPILEILLFLYVLGAFIFANMSGTELQYVTSDKGVAFALVNAMTGLPVTVMMILIVKNIAFGLGNDLEKGTIQTYLTYPMKRRTILAGRLLSAIGIPLLLLVGAQLCALQILVPDMLLHDISIISFTLSAVLAYPLLVAMFTLTVVLLLKKGSIALVVGLVLYLASGILTPLFILLSSATGSKIPLQIYATFNPQVALQQHFSGGARGEYWSPKFGEASCHMLVCYCLVILILIMCFIYFERRMEA